MMVCRLVTFGVVILLASCRPVVPTGTAAQDKSVQPSVSIIVYGDSGYHSAYLEKAYYKSPYKTPAEFAAGYRKKWLRSGKPADEFSVPELEFHQPSGSYIPKSGLYPVADAMTAHCNDTTCDFAVMLGDNIYPDGATLGADGIDDATRFRDLFTRPFAGLGKGSPDFRIYTTLGNHDWHTSREGAMAQVEFMERDNKFYMDGLFYSVVPAAGAGQIELFVVDTEMLLTTTPVRRAILNADGSEKDHDQYKKPRASALPRTDAEKAMLAWLGDALKASSAEWKIVMGHHPMWSAGGGKFEQARALRRLLRPLLCEHADAYLAGHEHTLEVYADSCEKVASRDKALVHIVSGAAGKRRSLHSPYLAQQNLAYPERRALFALGMIWGFAQITLQDDTLAVELFTTEGENAVNRIFKHVF